MDIPLLRWRNFLPAFLLLALTGGSSATAQEIDPATAVATIEQAIVQAIARAEPSVVSIARVKRPAIRDTFEERPNFPFPAPSPLRDLDDPESPDFIPTDFGSGVIIGVDPPAVEGPRKAYILTNAHVVAGGAVEGQPSREALRLYVRLADRRGFDARIYASDPRSDLAVIVIDTADVTPITYGNASQLKKGELVIALGNPYALARDGSPSASWGIISNLGRQPELAVSRGFDSAAKEETIHHLGNFLQVDTRLYLGTSGGALVNLAGELVGITTSLVAITGYEKSAGFAIPIDSATVRIIQTLRLGLEVEYGFLGVHLAQSVLSDEELRRFHERTGLRGGVQVMVLRNSPAARGKVHDGDYVLAVNDIPIITRHDLTREVGKIAPGEEVQLKVWRQPYDQPIALTVELGKWPIVDEEGIIATQRRYEPWRGLVVDYATARRKYGELAPQAPYPTGVLVLEVLPQSRAALADIEPGNFILRVNDQPVANPREFYDAVRTARGDVTLTLDGNRRAIVRAP